MKVVLIAYLFLSSSAGTKHKDLNAAEEACDRKTTSWLPSLLCYVTRKLIPLSKNYLQRSKASIRLTIIIQISIKVQLQRLSTSTTKLTVDRV